MPPVGETLREARLRQKIDIAEVESATKIRAKYLRALESEEFERLPGSTYAKTFLRTYAEFLGLDAHLLVEEYRLRHDSPGEDDVQQLAPPPPPRGGRGEGAYRPPGGGRMPGRATIIAGVAVGLLVLFLVIGLLSGDDGDEGTPAATDAARDDRGERRSGDAERSPPDRVALRIAPVEATFVCIDDGSGERVFEGVLESARTFKGKTLRLNLGRTSARLEANGERVRVPESTSAVGFEFTPDGQEELPVGERPCA